MRVMLMERHITLSIAWSWDGRVWAPGAHYRAYTCVCGVRTVEKWWVEHGLVWVGRRNAILTTRRPCMRAPASFPSERWSPAVGPDEALSSVWDMGRDGGQEVERGIDLEISVRSFHYLCLIYDGIFTSGVLNLIHRERVHAAAAGNARPLLLCFGFHPD